MAKSFIVFFITCAALLGVTPLSAATDWQTSKLTFHRMAFQLQLPGRLEARIQKNIQYWQSQTDGNSYWVAAKLRQCNQGNTPPKICDVAPVLRSILPSSAKHISQEKDSNGSLHLIYQDGDSFYYASVCFNDKVVVVLVTKTSQQESPDHQRFIESFTFLK